jgi:hypothetical protein
MQRYVLTSVAALLLVTSCSIGGGESPVSPADLPQASATLESASVLCFEKSTQVFASVPTWRIGLADLDADGDLDAVFANAQIDHSQVWLNDGSGFFSDTGQQLARYGHGVDIGEIDGDGDLDVIISPHQDSEASKVYLNDGNSSFEDLEGAFEANIGFTAELIDIDGDGDMDAIGEDTSATNIYLNDGAGHFTRHEPTLPITTIWGDLDSDGDVDVFIKDAEVGYAVLVNDGKGSFSQYWSLEDSTVVRFGDMALEDVDSDGDLDAIITNGHFQSTSYPAMVFLNDGTGRFEDSGQRLSSVVAAGVGLGDLDGDGDPDLLLTDYMGPCQIWLNDGSGRFMDSGLRLGGDQYYRHVHLGDLDGDDDLDIFLATFGLDQGPNEIWFNADCASP